MAALLLRHRYQHNLYEVNLAIVICSSLLEGSHTRSKVAVMQCKGFR